MQIRILPFVALALLLTGCRNAERIAERKVNALLPEVVGPAARYSSRVRGSIGALSRGRMDRIHIEGTDVQLSENLTADALVLDLSGVDVDTKAQKLRGVQSVAFTATLREANLNRYVRVRRPDIPDLAIALKGGQATLRARPEVYGLVGISVSVAGGVKPAGGGGALDFVPDNARVSIVPVPGPVLRYLVDKLNPVIDLSTLRIPVRVTDARIVNGSVVLTGSVEPADLLRIAAERGGTPSE